ncbi:MAG: hypothetical protein KatS3mg105_1052 [Gemmatales bacterium]|nr:MAG: hypothetical protein KatS3mg105_1052 [Gemmatales bacterium]
MDKPRFRIEFQALADDVPAVVRLRGLLKLAPRAFRLRCVDMREISSQRDSSGSFPTPANARLAAEQPRK